MTDRTVFLSYAGLDDHADAIPASWVTTFRNKLSAQLAVSGYRAKVHMAKIHSNNSRDFEDQYEREAATCQVMVVVFSKNWSDSGHCAKELAEFRQRANAAGRIVVARMQSFEKEYRKRFDKIVGHDFFLDPGDDTEPESFSPLDAKTELFGSKLNRLCKEIIEVFKQDDGAAPPPQAAAKSSVASTTRPSILLAYACRDCWTEKEEIFRALSAKFELFELDEFRKGQDLESVRAEYMDLAKRADGQVHLIGEVSEPFANASDKWIIEEQLDWSKEFPEKRRVFWVSPNATSSSSKNRHLISNLEKNQGTKDRLFRGDWGLALDEIVAELSRPQRPIYLIYHSEDRTSAADLSDALAEERMDFIGCPVSFASQRAQEMHQTNLMDAGVIVLLFGRSDLAWTQERIHELRCHAKTAGEKVRKVVVAGPGIENEYDRRIVFNSAKALFNRVELLKPPSANGVADYSGVIKFLRRVI